jgi:hypothetical protein
VSEVMRLTTFPPPCPPRPSCRRSMTLQTRQAWCAGRFSGPEPSIWVTAAVQRTASECAAPQQSEAGGQLNSWPQHLNLSSCFEICQAVVQLCQP